MDLTELPNEVMQHIFTFLDHQTRLAVREVCHKWNMLTYSAQSMDRIWLFLTFERIKSMLDETTPGISFRQYRHLIIDCHSSTTLQMNQLGQFLNAVHNVQSLVLFRINDATESDLLACLQVVPSLKRLYLLGTLAFNLQQACLSDIPKIVSWNYWWHNHGPPQWINIFAKLSKVVLKNVNDVFLAVPNGFNLSVDFFPPMFPNLSQLLVSMTDLSTINLIDAYNGQLKTFSVCPIVPEAFTPLCDKSFSHLSRLYLKFGMAPTNWSTSRTAYENFSTNCDLALKAICSNCSSLQILDVFVPKITFLADISKLKNLQKLSIHKSGEFYQTNSDSDEDFNLSDEFIFPNDRLPKYYPSRCQPVLSLKFIEISGSFRSITYLLSRLDMLAPNLEVLTLRDIAETEEALRGLSEKLPNLRHLKLDYRRHSGKQPKHNFGYLKNKNNLVTYSLTKVDIDCDGMQNWIQMAPNLNKIALKDCWTLSDAHLWTLASCCPKLKQIELADCVNKVTTQGLKEFRQNVTHLRITCKNNTNGDPFHKCSLPPYPPIESLIVTFDS